MCYCWRMTNFKRMLIALAAVFTAALGLVPATPVTPVVAAESVEVGAPMPEHGTGCTSYLFDFNTAKGYCTHLDGTAWGREWAVCRNYLYTAPLKDVAGGAVDDSYEQSSANCPSGYAVASHRFVVYQS